MYCLRCHINDAQIHPQYGVLPCKVCQQTLKRITRPKKTVEFTSEAIKQQRREYADDIEQPHHNGELNKRWVEIYGEQAALNHGFTKQEIKHAKYTWNSLGYYKRH